jgi:selenium metabolism protein YedF
MKNMVDARGLACPEPVINARTALEKNERITVIVDNDTALENICRMAASVGATVVTVRKTDGIYINLDKSPCSKAEHPGSCAETSLAAAGPRVLVISQDTLGKGDDALGRILIKSFFHTLAETGPVPDVILFYNSGVKLVVGGSEVIDDIKALEQKGIRLLACGTCLDFFNVKDKLQAGSVSNMYEIKDLMMLSGSTINL